MRPSKIKISDLFHTKSTNYTFTWKRVKWKDVFVIIPFHNIANLTCQLLASTFVVFSVSIVSRAKVNPIRNLSFKTTLNQIIDRSSLREKKAKANGRCRNQRQEPGSAACGSLVYHNHKAWRGFDLLCCCYLQYFQGLCRSDSLFSYQFPSSCKLFV